ncbi:hypothetical protein GCM10027569_07310 [Flindersiella endophytica]
MPPKPAEPPAKSALRQVMERRSYPLLRWLHKRPRWLVTGVLTALMVAGLFVPLPWGFVFLALFVLFQGWLAYLAWPASSTSQRRIYVIALGLALAAVVLRTLS